MVAVLQSATLITAASAVPIHTPAAARPAFPSATGKSCRQQQQWQQAHAGGAPEGGAPPLQVRGWLSGSLVQRAGGAGRCGARSDPPMKSPPRSAPSNPLTQPQPAGAAVLSAPPPASHCRPTSAVSLRCRPESAERRRRTAVQSTQVGNEEYSG